MRVNGEVAERSCRLTYGTQLAFLPITLVAQSRHELFVFVFSSV
jgi:hypothetical protein